MKNIALFISVFILTAGATIKQKQSLISPYPGGSPFPPGGAPSLTHIAKAFWTTQDGIITTIKIKAAGDRATQINGWVWKEGKIESIIASIAPDCDYNIMIAPSKMEKSIVANGYGEIEVRVFGFKSEDFNNPPEMSILYIKNGEEFAATTIKAQPVPENFKNKTEKEQD